MSLSPLDPTSASNIRVHERQKNSSALLNYDSALSELDISLKRYQRQREQGATDPSRARIDELVDRLIGHISSSGSENHLYPPILSVSSPESVDQGDDALQLAPTEDTSLTIPDPPAKEPLFGFYDRCTEFTKALLQAGQRDQLQKPPYSKVNVLIISWEDSKQEVPSKDQDDIAREVKAVEELFQDLLGYEVSKYRIPRDPQSIPYRELQDNIEKHAPSYENPDEKLLYIVYYTGHGSTLRDDACYFHPTYEDAKEFVRNRQRPNVKWNSIQDWLLADLRTDVLIILDCCYAGAAIPRARGPGTIQEILAACGKSQQTIFGEDSFTLRFVKLARELLKDDPVNGFKINELYGRLRRETPGNLPDPVREDMFSNSGSIRLQSLSRESSKNMEATPITDSTTVEKTASLPMVTLNSTTEEDITSVTAVSGSNDLLFVVVAIRLRESIQPTFDSWKQSFIEGLPKEEVDQIQAVNVLNQAELDAVFPMNSTLCIVSLPLHLWTLFPSNPACSVVGYVRGHNILNHQVTKSEGSPQLPKLAAVQSDTQPLTMDEKKLMEVLAQLHQRLEQIKKAGKSPGSIVTLAHRFANAFRIPARHDLSPEQCAYLIQTVDIITQWFVHDDGKGMSGATSVDIRYALQSHLDPLISREKKGDPEYKHTIDVLQEEVTMLAKQEAKKIAIDKLRDADQMGDMNPNARVDSQRGKGSESKESFRPEKTKKDGTALSGSTLAGRQGSTSNKIRRLTRDPHPSQTPS